MGSALVTCLTLGCPVLPTPAFSVPAPLTHLSPQKYLSVADLARKDKRVLRKKYQIYFW